MNTETLLALLTGTAALWTWATWGLVLYAIAAALTANSKSRLWIWFCIGAGGPFVWAVFLCMAIMAHRKRRQPAPEPPKPAPVPPEDPEKLLGEIHDYLAELIECDERAETLTVLEPEQFSHAWDFVNRIQRLRNPDHNHEKKTP